MSDRIRQLEDALAILQSSVSRESHPLLRRELLDIKSGLTLHSAINLKHPQTTIEEAQDEEAAYVDAFGTLAVRDDGAATFYGRSAGTEVSSTIISMKSLENDRICHILELATGEPTFRLLNKSHFDSMCRKIGRAHV